MVLSSKKEKKAEKELHPKDCVVRLCLLCKEQMKFADDDFDNLSADRFYTFHCDDCNIEVKLHNPTESCIALVDYSPEPLTKEEFAKIKEELQD